MTIRKTYNWLFLLMGISMLLWSCASEDSYYEEMEAVEEYMEMEASTDYEPTANATVKSYEIPEEQLRGFESRAKQKVEDLGDYISLISNYEYDRSLREHTMQQAIELFRSEKSVVEMDGFGLNFTKIHSIERFLKGALNNEYGLVTVRISNLQFSEGFSISSDSTYQGKILFTQTVERIVADEIAIVTEDKSAEIIIMKVTMEYGDDTEMVWQVLLDEIK